MELVYAIIGLIEYGGVPFLLVILAFLVAAFLWLGYLFVKALRG